MDKILLLGQPLSTNHIWKTTSARGFQQTYMTKDGRSLKDSYIRQAQLQWKKTPTDGEYGIEIDLYFGDRRKRDIDNYHKISLDALTGIVWNDDSQIVSMGVKKHYDKEHPRIEIKILAL